MRTLALLLCLIPAACATTGSAWMREGYGSGTNNGEWADNAPPTSPSSETRPRGGTPRATRTIGQTAVQSDEEALGSPHDEPPTRIADAGNGRSPRRSKPKRSIAGRVLGTFRNTYYDFPLEAEYSGEKVALHDAQCGAIAQVPRGFFEAVCVQGSGLLASGSPVSFNRRDCECAELCPRTQQKICFDTLERGKFPWGRGATGGAITPLSTVAVDSNVIPLGTPIYIPEYDGLPRDPARKSLHDGCFIAQDRGLRVQGQHVDLFTGQRSMTQLWNGLVPSNEGVTVVVDSPKCSRAGR